MYELTCLKLSNSLADVSGQLFLAANNQLLFLHNNGVFVIVFHAVDVQMLTLNTLCIP